MARILRNRAPAVVDMSLRVHNVDTSACTGSSQLANVQCWRRKQTCKGAWLLQPVLHQAQFRARHQRRSKPWPAR